MKILILCTAHNSLSQAVQLALAGDGNEVTVEYALSPETIIEATILAQPHIVVCTFLTTRVPAVVYLKYLTLIVHPGPPGDAGPSALDWLLMGDDGCVADADTLLATDAFGLAGRSYWGVTVLQAIEELDAGPVWAFEQFGVCIDDPRLTKSGLYRGSVTRAATEACLAATRRIEKEIPRLLAGYPQLVMSGTWPASCWWDTITPQFQPHPDYERLDINGQPFAGGQTHRRPLLRAKQREFDVNVHGATAISRRIRSADSQPGCLSNLFGPQLYLYGGQIESGDSYVVPLGDRSVVPGTVVSVRGNAVCVATRDRRGVWITHLRMVKRPTDLLLHVKVPAAPLLVSLGILPPDGPPPQLLPPPGPSHGPYGFPRAGYSTFQEVYVEYEPYGVPGGLIAYVTFDFYNGAAGTDQCRQLLGALESILDGLDLQPRPQRVHAVVVLGGRSYFSNGIHLNVIEAAADPAAETFANINAINEVAQMLLTGFRARHVYTIAALRGNAAAGGVALAAACDHVVAGAGVVLNPAYRALGLHGSEFHTISYPGRCGDEAARRLLRGMMPLTAHQARELGLVDAILDTQSPWLRPSIRRHVRSLLGQGRLPGGWKAGRDLSRAALAHARSTELSEMAKDLWTARAMRFNTRRRDFVRKVVPRSTPLRFALHRRIDGAVDEEETENFDRVSFFESLLGHGDIKDGGDGGGGDGDDSSSSNAGSSSDLTSSNSSINEANIGAGDDINDLVDKIINLNESLRSIGNILDAINDGIDRISNARNVDTGNVAVVPVANALVAEVTDDTAGNSGHMFSCYYQEN